MKNPAIFAFKFLAFFIIGGLNSNLGVMLIMEPERKYNIHAIGIVFLLNWIAFFVLLIRTMLRDRREDLK